MADDSSSGLDRALAGAARGEANLDEQRAFGAFRARLFGGDPRPLRIGGRYELGPLLGAGGIGAVYRAHDPELGRDVAVKVLQESGTEAGAAALLKEAQIIAKLSHPNVVEIYDVGLHDGEGGTPQLFFVMELVAGLDLRGALAEASWSDDRIFDVFQAAGRGLAAAHAQGLVHRDFKPHNVLVGEGGVVKVADFGAGAVLGTPRYMSPEQARSEPLDGRADQFSFCVALYEALEGELPRADADGPLREPTGPAARRVWPALRRGLALDVDQRFDDMNALLVALGRARTGPRWWWAVAGLGAVAAIASAWPSAEVTARCPDSAAFRDELWSAERRQAVGAAIHAAVPGRADEVFSTLAPFLDDYATSWAEHRSDACEAASEDAARCLGRRGLEFTALVDVLAAADSAVIDRAPQAVRRLPNLDGCLEPDGAEGIALPTDPMLRARVTALEEQLARIKALEAAGRYGDAVALAETTLAEAEKVGHDPTTALAAYRLGVVLVLAGRGEEAMPLLRRAAFSALEFGYDVVVAGAAIKLVARYGEAGELEAVDEWRRHAMTAIERGQLPEDIEARLHLELGASAYGRHDFETARDETQAAVRLFAASLGEEDPEHATALNNLAGAMYSLGNHDEALRLMERSSGIRRRVLGRSHPMLTTSLSNLGTIALELDRLDDAERYLSQAREALDADPSPRHLRRATLLLAEGALARKRGRLDEAIERIEASIEASNAAGGASGQSQTHRALMQLALTLAEQGKEEPALAAADSVVGACVEWGTCGTARMLRAITLAEFDRDDEARAERLRALEEGPSDAELELALDELLERRTAKSRAP